MLIYKTGDIFKEGVDALVNPVNCVGVMGKGLAVTFLLIIINNCRQILSGRNRQSSQHNATSAI